MTNPKINKQYTIVLEDFEFRGLLRRRPTSIRCALNAISGSPNKSITPISFYDHGGFNKLDKDRPLNTHFSHLVAHTLHGPDISKNIVPMYANLNKGNWSSMENEIKRYIGTSSYQYDMIVNISYPSDLSDEDLRVPKNFDIVLIPHGGSIRDAIDEWHFTHIKPEITQSVVNIDEFEAYIKETRFLAMADWSIENYDRNLNVSEEIVRNYEELDYISIEYGLYGRFNIKNGADFTEAQKKLILWRNRTRNNGYLKSDVKEDKYEYLLDCPGEEGAVIDHIKPKAEGGCNAFSNAIVVSSHYNQKKYTKKLAANRLDPSTDRSPVYPDTYIESAKY